MSDFSDLLSNDNYFSKLPYDENVALSVLSSILNIPVSNDIEKTRQQDFLLYINKFICKFDKAKNLYDLTKHKLSSSYCESNSYDDKLATAVYIAIIDAPVSNKAEENRRNEFLDYINRIIHRFDSFKQIWTNPQLLNSLNAPEK